MADRYWVSGSGTWNASETNRWSATSGGAAGASAPTASDNAIFDANSGLVNNTVITIAGTAACNDCTITGSAVKYLTLSLSGNFSPSGTLTINGNSAVNRIFIRSNGLGTARTITASAISMTNVDFRDITGAGAANWDLSAITGGSGDCLGNSGITFTTSATQTATGTSGFTWSTHGWTTRVPLPQDDVVIPNAFSASQTITIDMPYIGRDLDMSACTGLPIFTWGGGPGVSSFGDVIMSSDVNPRGGTSFWSLEGRGTHTITNNGCNWAPSSAARVQVNSAGGTYELQDDLTQAVSGSPSQFRVNNGNFNSNGHDMTIGTFITGNGCVIDLGDTVMTFNHTNSTTSATVAAGTFLTANQATMAFPAGTNTKAFTGGGHTYGKLSIATGGSGSITIAGDNTWGAMEVTGGSTATVIFTAGTTQTLTGDFFRGASGNVITIQSSSAGSPFTLTRATGTVTTDYLSLQDSAATGGAAFFAGDNSTSVSGNSGWIFARRRPRMALIGMG